MHSILVPVDFSEVTADVLEHAGRIAAAFSGKVSLLHVAAPDPDFVGWDPGPDVVRHQRATDLREEHRQLQELSQSLRDRGIEAHAVLVQGATVETILERAEKSDADLIIVGSHGHGALYRALLGSISEGVVRHATCPVLIVPAKRPN